MKMAPRANDAAAIPAYAPGALKQNSEQLSELVAIRAAIASPPSPMKGTDTTVSTTGAALEVVHSEAARCWTPGVVSMTGGGPRTKAYEHAVVEARSEEARTTPALLA